MNKIKVQEALSILGQNISGGAVEVGIRDDCAFLKIESASRWSVIWTPGDRWFSVDTDLGYSLNYFDEGLSDSDAVDVLRFHVGVGAAYVQGAWSSKKSKILRVPELHIKVDGQVAILTMSLAAAVRYALGFNRRDTLRALDTPHGE